MHMIYDERGWCRLSQVPVSQAESHTSWQRFSLKHHSPGFVRSITKENGSKHRGRTKAASKVVVDHPWAWPAQRELCEEYASSYHP